MTAMIMFGRTTDGTLSQCTAKPENRGKGNCPHSSHFKLPADKAEQILKKDAERQLEKQHNKLIILKKRDEKRARKEKIREAELKRFEKFINSERTKIEELTEQLSSENVEHIDNFVKDLEELSSNNTFKTEADIEKLVKEYLMSDNYSARKVLEEFGDAYTPSDISELLVRVPTSMTKKSKSKNGNNSSSRIILSGVENNMDRSTYIKSVVYFGGKCCYCGITLKTEDGENYRKATGEHLSPLSPDNKDSVRSSTRFGNMALCCDDCNHSKGNEDLEQWIVKSSRVKKARKIYVIAKIRAFRRFAGYKDFSKEFSQEIDKSLEHLHQESERMRSEGENPRKLKEMLNDELYKLRNFPNKYES